MVVIYAFDTVTGTVEKGIREDMATYEYGKFDESNFSYYYEYYLLCISSCRFFLYTCIHLHMPKGNQSSKN